MTRKDYNRAVGIIRAHDSELRTLLIDAFTDFFRWENPHFDAVLFEALCRIEGD